MACCDLPVNVITFEHTPDTCVPMLTTTALASLRRGAVML